MEFEGHEDKQVKISLSELQLKAWKLTVFSRKFWQNVLHDTSCWHFHLFFY